MDPVTVLNQPPAPAPAPVIPQQPVGAPAPSAAPAAPVGAPPTVAPLGGDTLIDIGGGRVMKASDVIGGYNAAVELGLHDNDNRIFMQTVYRATQGDEQALAQLAAIQAKAPGPAHTPAAPATPQPGAPPAGGATPRANEFASVMQKMLEPIAHKVNEMYGVHTASTRDKEIGAMKTFFTTKKEQYPCCAEIEGAATRVYDRYDALRKINPRAGAAELGQIMQEEEAYLAGARPSGAAAPANPEVIRMDAPASRVPGLTPPGRIPPNNGQPVTTGPSQMPVSTHVPSAGAPSGAPGQSPNANQPMTMESLTADIERQVNGMGIRTR